MTDDPGSHVEGETCEGCLWFAQELRKARSECDWSRETDIRVLRKRHLVRRHAEAEAQT